MLKRYFATCCLCLFAWSFGITPLMVVQANDQLKDVDQNYSIKNKTVDDILYDTISEFGYNSDQISIAFYDFIDDTHYTLNSDITMLGASTTKVATAALYTSLINEGYLSFDTPIPFVEAMFEEGGGNITNSPIQPSYALQDLIYEMLINSDNTAWNLLTHYYFNYIGNHQNDMLMLSGADIYDPELYQFNHVNAEVLEGILIAIASSDYYSNVVDTMLAAQPHWLLKYYLNDNMAVKYGYLDEYFHDTGIYFDENGEPLYTLVVMTDSIGLDYDGMQNEFFGLINLRLNRWFEAQHESNSISKTL